MDKLSEHNIRMLEIADANDIPGIGNKQLKDIAIAVYDTILQVQMLKMADCEICGHWWKSEEVCLLDDCQYEPIIEPQTIYYPQVDGITPSVIKPKTEPSDSEKPNNCEWSVEYAKAMLDTMSCEECGHWKHGAGDRYFCALLTIGQECHFEPKDESKRSE